MSPKTCEPILQVWRMDQVSEDVRETKTFIEMLTHLKNGRSLTFFLMRITGFITDLLCTWAVAYTPDLLRIFSMPPPADRLRILWSTRLPLPPMEVVWCWRPSEMRRVTVPELYSLCTGVWVTACWFTNICTRSPPSKSWIFKDWINPIHVDRVFPFVHSEYGYLS